MPTENRSSNTEQMVNELLPCPFCNQQDAFVEQLDSDSSIVICQGRVGEHSACLARGPVGVQESDDEIQPGHGAAVRAWNQRAQAEGYSAGDMADQGAKAFRDGQQPITELTDDLREILGRPNFACHHIAQALRQMGHTIAKKSEDEQASVIHWMLGHYLKHGPDWRRHASEELKAASQAAE